MAVTKDGNDKEHSSTGDAVEAGEVLSRLLAAVEAGELDADTPQARRLLRRLEGAVAAWKIDVELAAKRAQGWPSSG